MLIKTYESNNNKKKNSLTWNSPQPQPTRQCFPIMQRSHVVLSMTPLAIMSQSSRGRSHISATVSQSDVFRQTPPPHHVTKTQLAADLSVNVTVIHMTHLVHSPVFVRPLLAANVSISDEGRDICLVFVLCFPDSSWCLQVSDEQDKVWSVMRRHFVERKNTSQSNSHSCRNVSTQPQTPPLLSPLSGCQLALEKLKSPVFMQTEG